MRLWTVQDKAAYDCLCKNSVLRCDAQLAELLREKAFKCSYDWLAAQMKTRVGEPPADVLYPIWAWYLLNGKNAKPDLRRCEFRGFSGENYIIEAEIPDGEVLISDEEMWHLVLNDGYFGKGAEKSDGGKEYEEDEAWFDSLPPDEQEHVKRESWENIFNSSRCPWVFVQATFWELRQEQVVSVRRFIGRRIKSNGD
jgi:hypothetical protein